MKRPVLFSPSARQLAVLALAAACSACQYMPQEAKVDLVQAPPQRPSAVAPTPPVTGGLFHPATFRPALEDRRAKLLALTLGSPPYWKDRLIAELDLRNAA